MSLGLAAVLAFLPILTALVLMIGLSWPASRAMPLAWLTAVLTAALFWGLPLRLVLASTLAGFGSAFNVLIIIFGALVLLFTLRESGGMEAIKGGLSGVGGDRRVQLLVIAFLFGAFLEGAAGFGAPAAVAAPLLISLGFPALAAVIFCLVFNSFPVSFGVIGLVIWFGLGNLDPLIAAEVANGQAPPGMTPSLFHNLVGRWAAVFNLPAIYLLPLGASAALSRFFGPGRSWREGLSAWKFCLLASTCFAVPYVLAAFTLGVEFPSLLGGLLGLGGVTAAVKKGWCLPPRTWDFAPRDVWRQHWGGALADEDDVTRPRVGLILAWLPYALIGLILVLTRLKSLPLAGWVAGPEFSLEGILGCPTVRWSLRPLHSPGILPFMFVALLCIPLHRMKPRAAVRAWREALVRIKAPTLALMFAVALVEIMKQSAHNSLGLPSMPLSLAQAVAGLAGGSWPLAAPLVGAMGAFITGSNTVSNLLFADFQFGVAGALDLPRQIVVALQVVGGSMGNMVCVHNIVAASAVVGLVGMEGRIIRVNTLPMVLYAATVGIMGMVFCYLWFPGLF